MYTFRRLRGVPAGLAVTAGLCLTGTPALAAAPYVADATVQVPTTNPQPGQALPIVATNFDGNEQVFVELYSDPVLLLTTNAVNGKVSVTVTIPQGFSCQHSLVVRDASAEDVAITELVIGDASACTGGSGPGTGSGNVGNGNTGDRNVGNGNAGSGNVGNGNTGSGNVGNGNKRAGTAGNGDAPGWGNVSYAASSPVTADHRAEIMLAALAGLALAGSAGLLRRSRRDR